MNWPIALVRLGTPLYFDKFNRAWRPWCLVVSSIALLYGLLGGLFLAPPDYQQGEAFRIIYVHVPCAMLSIFLYAAMAASSFVYLVWRIKLADIMAYCIAPIGAFFTFAALVTGSLWGKPMWGTYWIWDARLTSELILLFLYLGYMGLYQAVQEPKAAARLSAILAIVGLLDLPIIHYSVYWWNTLHQGATITKFERPSIDSSMLYPLLAMIVGLGLYALYLLSLRVSAEINSRESKRQRLMGNERL